MQREQAVRDPSGREQHEHAEHRQGSLAPLNDGQRLVPAVVADPNPGPMTRTRVRRRFIPCDLSVRRGGGRGRLRKLRTRYSKHGFLGCLRTSARRFDRRRRRTVRFVCGFWLLRRTWNRRHSQDRLLPNAGLRRDSLGRLPRLFGLFVNADARLIEPLWRMIPHGITALAAKRVVGRDSSSALRTVHVACVPYQISGRPAYRGMPITSAMS